MTHELPKGSSGVSISRQKSEHGAAHPLHAILKTLSNVHLKSNMPLSIDNTHQPRQLNHRLFSPSLTILSKGEKLSFAPSERNIPPTQKQFNEISKAAQGLLIVVIAYFVCMLPFSVTKLYKVVGSQLDSAHTYGSTFATIFQYIASAINPLMYCFFRRDFQKAFRFMIQKTRVKKMTVNI